MSTASTLSRPRGLEKTPQHIQADGRADSLSTPSGSHQASKQRPGHRALERAAAETRPDERTAIESRHETWLENASELSAAGGWAQPLRLNIDSPIGDYIDRNNDAVYLGMHEGTPLYAHYYTDEELLDDTERLLAPKPFKNLRLLQQPRHARKPQRMRKLLEKLATATKPP